MSYIGGPEEHSVEAWSDNVKTRFLAVILIIIGILSMVTVATLLIGRCIEDQREIDKAPYWEVKVFYMNGETIQMQLNNQGSILIEGSSEILFFSEKKQIIPMRLVERIEIYRPGDSGGRERINEELE